MTESDDFELKPQYYDRETNTYYDPEADIAIGYPIDRWGVARFGLNQPPQHCPTCRCYIDEEPEPESEEDGERAAWEEPNHDEPNHDGG